MICIYDLNVSNLHLATVGENKYLSTPNIHLISFHYVKFLQYISEFSCLKFPPKVAREFCSEHVQHVSHPRRMACGPRTTCALINMRQDGRIRHYVTPHGDVIEILLISYYL